jgi:hypothetical protein
MKTLEAKVLSILKLQPYQMRDKSTDQNKHTIINFGGSVFHISGRRRSMKLYFVGL